MDAVVPLGIAVAGLTVWLLYEKNKRESAEALNDNLETKEKVDAINKDVIKNEALIAAEEEKRKEIEKKLEEEKNKDVSKDDLTKFFNDRK